MALRCSWSDTRGGVIVNKNLSFRTIFRNGVAAEAVRQDAFLYNEGMPLCKVRPVGPGKPFPDAQDSKSLTKLRASHAFRTGNGP